MRFYARHSSLEEPGTRLRGATGNRYLTRRHLRLRGIAAGVFSLRRLQAGQLINKISGKHGQRTALLHAVPAGFTSTVAVPSYNRKWSRSVFSSSPVGASSSETGPGLKFRLKFQPRAAFHRRKRGEECSRASLEMNIGMRSVIEPEPRAYTRMARRWYGTVNSTRERFYHAGFRH